MTNIATNPNGFALESKSSIRRPHLPAGVNGDVHDLKRNPHAHVSKTRSSFQSGFTLVEILVSITIIVVLAGLVSAVSRNLRSSGDSVLAIGRIKTLAQANATYAVDHRGKYVPVFAFDGENGFKAAWFYNMEFMESITGNNGFLDNPVIYEGNDGYPESVLDPVVVRAKQRMWSRTSASYGYNQENMPGGDWGQPNTSRSHTIYSVASPEKTFQFITATDWTAKYTGRDLWKSSPVEGRTQNGKIAFRHKGKKALAVFYDGHVESLSREDIVGFDRRGGINNVFWGGSQQ